MGIIDRLVKRWGYQKTQDIVNPASWLRATAAAEKFSIPSGELYRNQAELYQRLSWVHIAIQVVSQSIAGVPFSVKTYKNEDEEDIINHPFEQLLHQPNPLMSRFEFFEATASYRALTGNAYWWLNRPGKDAEPAEIWVIPSYKIKPVPDERLFLKGYLYDPGDGQEIPLETWEVVHFKKYHPSSPFVGLSPIEALATIAVGDLKMQEWNTRLFADNNARLPGILAFKDAIPDPEWNRLKEEVSDASAKRNYMMMRNSGPGGVEWLKAAYSQQEMEFLQGREANKEEIFSMYAPGLSSMLDVNATEANAKTGRATFSEYCLWPILVSMAEKITNDVLPVWGDNLLGEFEDIRYTDRSLELAEQDEYSKTHTIDEIRGKFYQEDELGDERGEMLPAQIGAAPVSVGDEEEAPIPAPDLFQPREPEMPESEQESEEVADDEAKADLAKWKKKALFRVKRGDNAACEFVSDAIPTKTAILIGVRLSEAETEDEVKAAFDPSTFTPPHTTSKVSGVQVEALTAAVVEATRQMREAA